MRSLNELLEQQGYKLRGDLEYIQHYTRSDGDFHSSVSVSFQGARIVGNINTHRFNFEMWGFDAEILDILLSHENSVDNKFIGGFEINIPHRLILNLRGSNCELIKKIEDVIRSRT